MCDPVTAALIISTVAGGTKAVNAGIAGKRQDRATARGIREQSELQRGANLKVNERISDIASSTGEQERAEALEGFLNTLRSSSDITGAERDPLGLGGSRFAERVGTGEARTRAAGADRAGRLSVIDAAGRQRVNESGRVLDTATQLDEIQRQSQAADFITRLRVASKRPNPVVDALANTAQGVASIIALKPGSGGTDLAKLFSEGTLVDAPVRAPSNIFGTVA